MLLSTAMFSQKVSWTTHTFNGKGGEVLPFQIAQAMSTPAAKRPLVLFLHGAGERGRDNAKQLTHGKEVLAKAATEHGAIVLAPQCPWTSYWANVDRGTEPVTGRVSLRYPFRANPTPALQSVIHLLDSLLASGSVDTNAIHLVGISMGGMGVLELAARMPGRFASVTSMAGTYGPQIAPILALTPKLRFFHGDKDFLVHVDITRALVKRIKSFGGNVDYIEFEGANHNSWDPAFAMEGYWGWVFEE